ncbi:MAG: nucleotidyltransferase domain-containing protein [Deltaproteobacteria bacterium]|nr:nucleotidyltransferase domain-containing protein [Deltaproteobacteria bacterium]
MTPVPIQGTSVPAMGTELSSLFPSTRRALLECLYLNPDEKHYLRELIRIVNKGQGGVQREISRLVASGLVSAEKSGGRTYYSANKEGTIFAELSAIISKTVGVLAALRQALSNVDGIDFAFVFGSVARGRARPDSDVDLAVIGQVRFRDVIAAIAPVQLRLGREINPVVYSAEEFSRRYDERDHFICELAQTDKQFLVGERDDLAAVVG